MKKDYDDFVEGINKVKKLVSIFNTNVQKKIALYMWDYVRDHLDELHDMLTEEEIDSGDVVDYGYVVVESIKQHFCEKLDKDTGLVVDWDNYCILCHQYEKISRGKPCDMCPLKSCAETSENPYHTLVEYAFHKKNKNDALSAIYTITKAIKGAVL